MIHIFWRTTDKVLSLHGYKRPFNLTKKEIIQICWWSLQNALINVNHKLTIISDDSKDTSLFTKFSIIHEKLGNEGSMRKAYKLAKELPPEDDVFFLEDDYYMLPHSLTAITQALNQNKGIFIHPSDYPNFYEAKHQIPSKVFYGKGCSWREVPNTTGTFACKVKNFLRYYNFFYGCGQDDVRISTLFGWNYQEMDATGKRQAVLIAPIPTLSAHLHIGTMPFDFLDTYSEQMIKHEKHRKT